MVKTREIDLPTRGSIKTLKSEGYSSRQIQEKLGIPYSTINYTLRRLELTKSHCNKARTGRPRKTTAIEDQKIIDFIEKSEEPNASILADRLAEMNIAKISARTVRRRLNENGLHGRSPLKKPLLTKKHIDDWKGVLFSDETKINKRGSDGKVWTWKRTNEMLKPKHVKQTVKHDASIMVWGCFNSTGVGDIYIIEGTMNAAMYIRILSGHMLPSARRLFQGNFIFQQDNDPKHTAKRTKAYMNTKKIELLDWPSQSPDLNPIENLWHKLKLLVGEEKITKKTDLPEAIKRCWESITPEYCNSLIESMPRRMDQLVKNKGLWINY
jgi:transposase